MQFFLDLIQAAIAQDRAEREERPDIAYHDGLMDGKQDTLAAKLERLAEGIKPEHQHWIWAKEPYYHLKVISVFQSVNAKYRKNRKTPLAAVQAALEEVEDEPT